MYTMRGPAAVLPILTDFVPVPVNVADVVTGLTDESAGVGAIVGWNDDPVDEIGLLINSTAPAITSATINSIAHIQTTVRVRLGAASDPDRSADAPVEGGRYVDAVAIAAASAAT